MHTIVNGIIPDKSIQIPPAFFCYRISCAPSSELRAVVRKIVIDTVTIPGKKGTPRFSICTLAEEFEAGEELPES